MKTKLKIPGGCNAPIGATASYGAVTMRNLVMDSVQHIKDFIDIIRCSPKLRLFIFNGNLGSPGEFDERVCEKFLLYLEIKTKDKILSRISEYQRAKLYIEFRLY